MPFWLAVIVVVFGCIILLEGIWKDERVSIPLHDLRPAFFVTLAITDFPCSLVGVFGERGNAYETRTGEVLVIYLPSGQTRGA